MELIRWGGLSSVNHKKACKLEENFHRPPLKRGIYVFHPKWIEIFLVAWKWYEDNGDKKKCIEKQRRFNYEGKIWTHIFHNHPEITYYRQKGSWYETDTKCIKKIFELEKKCRSKDINNDKNMVGDNWYQNAYKWMGRDSMELFIERL